MKSIVFLFLAVLAILLLNVGLSDAHARLIEPAARSSAWRRDGRFPTYYSDNQMSCGGFYVQWTLNGGRCGICGEVYNEPKKFEKGGSLYRGIIVRNYVQGQNIDVAVEVTANHKGFFEFRICDIDGLNTDATQACLDKTPLTDKNGNTRFPLLTESATVVSLKLKLPSKLTCKNCVIQWKYNTANSWGRDTRSGKSCVGCGPQEQFYGCADVSISAAKPKSEKLIGAENSSDLPDETQSEKPKIQDEEKSKTQRSLLLAKLDNLGNENKEENY